MSNKELKSCPFCGNNEKGKIYVVPDQDEYERIFGYFVECGGCDATGSYREIEEEAIKYWNNRYDG